MSLLGLDLGFRMGYALIEAGEPPISGSIPIPGSSEELGRALHSIGEEAKGLIAKHKPSGLVLCRPYIAAFAFQTKTGLNRMTPNATTSIVLDGMFGIVNAIAWPLRLPVYPVQEGTVRKAFGISVPKIKNPTKRRRALKAAVVSACRDNGWYVADDHAGDALLAAAYQFGKLDPGEAHLLTPMFSGQRSNA